MDTSCYSRVYLALFILTFHYQLDQAVHCFTLLWILSLEVFLPLISLAHKQIVGSFIDESDFQLMYGILKVLNWQLYVA